MSFIIICYPYPRRKPPKSMFLPSFVHAPGSMKGAKANYIILILTKLWVESARLSGATAKPHREKQPQPQNSTPQGNRSTHSPRVPCHAHTEWTRELLENAQPPPPPPPHIQLWNHSHSSPEALRQPRAKQAPQMQMAFI